MDEALDGWLEAQLQAVGEERGQVFTIADGRPNRIVDVTTAGVRLETATSDAKGTGPQLVPAWMLNAAWRHLQAAGTLTHSYLRAPDGLDVKRASAVCALLAQLPGVTVASRRPVELRLAAGGGAAGFGVR